MRKSIGANWVEIGADAAETWGNALGAFSVRCLDVLVRCLDEFLSNDFFFFFLGGEEESPAEESRRLVRGDCAEPGVDRFEGVGTDFVKTTVDAEAMTVDVIGADCVDAAGEAGGRAERADSIKAVLSLASRALRVRAEKLRQWVQVSVR